MLGLAVDPDDAPATALYASLGHQRHPTLGPVDMWEWVDEGGTRHEQRDPCD